MLEMGSFRSNYTPHVVVEAFLKNSSKTFYAWNAIFMLGNDLIQ